jgi:hypothetical protein
MDTSAVTSSRRSTPPRLYYLADERTPGDQRGPRQTFETLRAGGVLDEVAIFPFLFEAAQHGADAARQRLIERAADLQPDIIIWSHVSRFPVTDGDLAELRSLPSRPLICFIDIDPWGRWRKPITRPMRRLITAADVVYLSCGDGRMAKQFCRAGAADVRHLVQTYDASRFGGEPPPAGPRRFDVVMVGNRITSRVPLRRLPGAREREQLARELGSRFGDRFGLFGEGWDGFTGARGPVAFDDQGTINRSAWVAAGWDHFAKTPRYFSNRLPIALASGTPYVGNDVPGLDALVPPGSGVLTAPTPTAVADVVTELLALPHDELVALGQRAVEAAEHHLCQQHHYTRLVESLIERRHAGDAVRASG